MSFFFQAGGALPENHPAYIVRDTTDNDALNYLLGSQMLHVIAPRQVGKTSLLHHLKNLLIAVGWRCALVDLSLLIGLSDSDWYIELGNILASQITPDHQPSFTNHIGMRHYLTNQAMSYSHGKQRIALFFDEVESVIRETDVHGRTFSDAFFMTIRNLYNERNSYEGTLVVTMAGAISPINLVKDQAISPFNVGQNVSLEDFTQTETKKLTAHLLELGTSVEDTIHETIYSWTNGHPYLTHRLCFDLERLIHNHHPSKITSEDVLHLVEQAFLQSANPLMQDSNLKHITRALNRLPEPAKQLWIRLKRGESILTMSIDGATFQDLYLTGVCKAENRHVVIRNHIYKDIFVKKLKQEPRQGREIPIIQEAELQSIELFYSYANQDERLRKQLETHLSGLRQQKVITEWYNRKIAPGTNWEQSIDAHLTTATVILLLVSPDFLASDYCYGVEMQHALARHAAGDACVIPLILRPVDWQRAPFAHLQCVPTSAKPVTSWSNRDEAFRDVAISIRTVIESLHPPHSPLSPTQ